MGPVSTSLRYSRDIRVLGIISDLHGNLPALQAVFAEAVDISEWICVGDVVGYYTEPNEVCDLLRSRNIPTVVGNHDLYVLGELPYSIDRERHYRTIWSAHALKGENLKRR